ncbi:MAG: amino acid transporter [Gemmataceae bacterium]|nr:amino acid transporter [Gemmataceae bacterium]
MSTTPTTPVRPDGAAVAKNGGAEYHWLWVMCLLGLDYFSTLAYQPSITYHETKLLGPLATAAVVLVTLLGALPVYCYLAGRSPGGQGSLGIVEKLIRGWRGKTLVLILLGFAATDFTMLKSLSLADASVHVLNQHDGDRLASVKELVGWCKDCARDYVHENAADHVNEQLVVTILLGIIAFVFWFLLRKGFNRNVIFLAVPLVGLYLLMTGVLIAAGLWRLFAQPQIVSDWLHQVEHGEFVTRGFTHDVEGWRAVLFWSVIALPKLALGLSGFELSMILMPQVAGKPDEHPPKTRIGNTRKVLVLAAVIMSVYLLGAVLVTTLLIPEAAYGPEGHANNRALAYLAHGGKLVDMGNEPLLPICGVVFGTVYDVVTVLILCMAGTSVITALAMLMPLFLLRFGMEFRWTQRWGVLLVVFAVVNTLVTLWFKADVEDQRNAYATGVLVLMACAAVVTVFEIRRSRAQSADKEWLIVYFFRLLFYGLIAIVFVATMLTVAAHSGGGLGIALCFIAAILAMSILSRAWRADELRTVGFAFKDDQSKFMWDSLRLADFPVLVPVRPGRISHDEVEMRIRAEHSLAPETDIVCLEVCVDDPSDFFQTLTIEVVRENSRYVIRVTNGVSVAQAIAAIALEMSRHSRPPGLHFGWPELDMLSASWSYLAFGEGNIPWKVRELIHRAEKDKAKRPRVIVG